MDYNTRVALILLIIGAFILAAIVLLHKPAGKKKRDHASRRVGRAEPRIEPGLVADTEAVEAALDADTEPPTEPEPPAADARQEPLLPDTEAEEDEPDDSPRERMEPMFASVGAGRTEKIVTLYLRGRDGQNITGVSVLDAALKAGLQFGEMNIFHRRHEGGDRSVFSMANLVKPGSFDPAAWNMFESPGLTLFMPLPGPVSALDGWDAMLATGQRLAELLNAELLDDTQSQLSRQRIAQMRDEMRDYDRKTGL